MSHSQPVPLAQHSVAVLYHQPNLRGIPTGTVWQVERVPRGTVPGATPASSKASHPAILLDLSP